ncbi:hypothetical protein LWF01_17240 [Saxibacter everestensis]|uniref:DUF2029 domain-containing protein n=1 Tax=Saxibacter everestensis TaxID=2909229 RepID=A0ABY8QUE7_9MICO|nr:hypothetical protein LWF01_17240 [Brevibacteriaceae bacterium ZFBP1038]
MPTPPSQRDPIARWASPVIGGVLGSRAASYSRTWFQSAQIFLLSSAAMFGIGLFVQAPCYGNGWVEAKKFTRVCSTPLIDQYKLLVAPVSSEQVITSPASGTASGAAAGFGAPGHELLFRALATLVPDGSLTAQSRWFFVIAMFVIALGLGFAVLATARILGDDRRWQLATFGLSAVLPLALPQSFTIVAIALSLWGLIFWLGATRRGRSPMLGGLLIGLAALFSPLAMLFALAIVIHSAKQWSKRGGQALMLAGSATVVLAIGFLLTPDRFQRLSGMLDDPVGPGSLVWTLIPLHISALPNIGLVLAGIGIAATLVLTTALALASHRQWGIAPILLLLFAGTFLVLPSLPPQLSLWFVPLACIAVRDWRLHLPWMLIEVFFVICLSLYQHGDVVENKGGPLWAVAVFIVLRLAAITAIAGFALSEQLSREIRHPRTPAGSRGFG